MFGLNLWPDLALLLVVLLLLLVPYFVPAWIAFARRHPHRRTILLINLFAGWTVLGGVAALVWAFMSLDEREGRRA